MKNKLIIEYKLGYFDALAFIVRELPMPIRDKIALQLLQAETLKDLIKAIPTFRKVGEKE